MAINVYVSYDKADQKHHDAYAALKKMSRQILDTHDRGIKMPSADNAEQTVLCPFNDCQSKGIRDEILKKFEQCYKLVVLVGNDTFKDRWVEWEVNNFFRLKDALWPGKAWVRIRAMTLEGCDHAATPAALECRSTKRLTWDPDALEYWLEEETGG
ncbi:MAG TPA: TIR domain-containing protein [Candidatus Omnitrophota bacterium]|nr:TIR domain-containing protein [Candidatus Omnitrophota bacterium]HQJ14950.1 TIR domain-containing protein [Candidatus Omnitrophota bacterium]